MLKEAGLGVFTQGSWSIITTTVSAQLSASGSCIPSLTLEPLIQARLVKTALPKCRTSGHKPDSGEPRAALK